MFNFLERSLPIFGEEGIDKLQNSTVVLLGVGGVGGGAAEGLCRAGVGTIVLVDNDEVSLSNCNRQLVATTQTIGRPKVEVAKERLLAINPLCNVITEQRFYLPEESEFLFSYSPNVVLDAIDTVTAKLHLAQECSNRGVQLISSMGTGNRCNPSCLRIGDIAETSGNGCPLARIMRRELKKRGVKKLQTVYSVEKPTASICVETTNGRHAPASTAFVPPAAGFLLAYGAVSAILERKDCI